MNLRTMSLAEEILAGLDILNITEDALVVVYLPAGLNTTASEMIGASISSALKAIGKSNPIILLPRDIKLESLSESQMKEHGWIRDVKPRSSNISNSGLQRDRESTKSYTDMLPGHFLSQEDIANFNKAVSDRWRRGFDTY